MSGEETADSALILSERSPASPPPLPEAPLKSPQPGLSAAAPKAPPARNGSELWIQRDAGWIALNFPDQIRTERSGRKDPDGKIRTERSGRQMCGKRRGTAAQASKSNRRQALLQDAMAPVGRIAIKIMPVTKQLKIAMLRRPSKAAPNGV